MTEVKLNQSFPNRSAIQQILGGAKTFDDVTGQTVPANRLGAWRTSTGPDSFNAQIAIITKVVTHLYSSASKTWTSS
jgi:hypothetical protein